jgi:predicted GNAT superfamily acetyltransferase
MQTKLLEPTHSVIAETAGVQELGPSAPVQVRRLSSLVEFHSCEELQARVWGPEDVVRVPSLVMVTAQINGGFVLGAFAGEKLVGFVLASPGLAAGGHVKQGSVLMAVDPAYQSRGVGYRLKLAQREVALEQGIDLITWTFDPLASINSYLNLHKLGCVASRYVVDLYGVAERGLNAGLPTDRLLVEWWIRQPAVVDRLAGVPVAFPEAAPVNEVFVDPRTGLPALCHIDLERGEPALLVEIPESIREVKLADMKLARRWRYGLREIFQSYFARGYRATGFHRLPVDGRIGCCFVLESATARQSSAVQ